MPTSLATRTGPHHHLLELVLAIVLALVLLLLAGDSPIAGLPR
jgi:hypothetical protein